MQPLSSDAAASNANRALNPTAYYAAIGAALFPIPAGAKNPTGIIQSFALDCSRDPAQWAAWQAANPGCNFGMVAGPSGLIVADIDIKDGRDAAWALWCELCTAWGVAAIAPQVQSARGGWHVLFRVPDGVDARSLRQPDVIKGLINIRAGNGYVVCAGSYYDGTAKGEASGPYLLMSDAAPHAAPAALLKHCTRAERSAAVAVTGSRDKGDTAGLVKWLTDRDSFANYEDWLAIGMALKLEFGDEGLELWRITHDDTVTADVEVSKWASFATEPTPGCTTLNSQMQRAHAGGWKGSIRASAASMFGTVGDMTHAAGATLPLGATGPANENGRTGAVPMLAGQQALTDLAAPILTDFLVGTSDCPTKPMTTDYPKLPESLSTHGLYSQLREAIHRIVAMSENAKLWKRGARCIEVLAVLDCVHKDVYESLVRKLKTAGADVAEQKVKFASKNLFDRVQRVFVKKDDWILDFKGLTEHNNPDNVEIFLGIIGCEVRWNAWLEQAEIQGGDEPGARWDDWSYIDDTVFAKLKTRAKRTGTRFVPGDTFLWDTLLAIAHLNTFDPVLSRFKELQEGWDKLPRLDSWLARACGVPDDAYHRAVGRNIIGGMARRARRPGCKHDTMVIMFGPQGTGKSTLAAMLALNAEWFSDSILLGEAAKELVLSLAGKLVVEISEMGMRNSANAATIKAMVGRQRDEGRTAYARAVSKRPRRNIFFGTTNDDKPLSDSTGNRRFLSVEVLRAIDLAWVKENLSQLIGEAATVESSGVDFNLPPEVWGIAAEHAEAARSESNLEIRLNDWFGETEHSNAVFITSADLVELCTIAGLRGNYAFIMKRLGFRSERVPVGGEQKRSWYRGPDVLPKHIAHEAVRYAIGTDGHGRPRVLTQCAAPPLVPGQQTKPPLPPAPQSK